MASAARLPIAAVSGENDDFHWSSFFLIDSAGGEGWVRRRRVGTSGGAAGGECVRELAQLLTVNSPCSDATWPPVSITSSRVMSAGFLSMTTTGMIGLRPAATIAGTS